MATGRCLCGAVRFEVDEPLHGVVLCHCDAALRWIDSPDSDAHARRGFCGECGSSLFWDAPERDGLGIAAGSLDPPTGLETVGEIYSDDASDYYEPGGSR